ncbi:MAG: chorismate synthase [Deltaproteobacteria bacterium]|nr:MAG: chorismate synthase [Deltaproteobacteria bacterium]
MPGNTFGSMFRVTTWGESHGPALGAVVDGCPPGLTLTADDIDSELAWRRSRDDRVSTSRREPDQVEILSGVFEDRTTGTPISMIIHNRDVVSSAYADLKDLFRPGHADYTYWHKYGIRDWRGGGRASGRETVARVAAGAVAKKLLEQEGIKILAYTLALGGVKAQKLNFEAIHDNSLFCPDPDTVPKMLARLQEVKAAGDSVGGIVEIRAQGCPAGLGEPVFAKLDAMVASALMGIGAVKGVEIGSGFAATAMLGSEHNDALTPSGFLSNNAGGILGGISNGEEIVARVAVKPIPSIEREQQTIKASGDPTTLSVKGRHDVSAIPRIVPVCGAMVRLVLADMLMQQRAIR